MMKCAIAVTAGLLLLTPAAARAQNLSRLDRDRGKIMLQQVRDAVQELYYDSTYHGVDLAGRESAMEDRIGQAASLADMLASIAAFPLSLNDSHTFFVPPAQAVHVDYGWEMLIVGDSAALISRVRPGSDAEKQGVHPGDRVLRMMGYLPTRENLWLLYYLYYVLRPQRGLDVILQTPSGQIRELALAAKVHRHYQIQDLIHGEDLSHLIRDSQREEREFRIRWAELGQDVLLLELPTFELDPRDLRDAMKHARDRKTVILDLRGNSGGYVKTLQMLVGLVSPGDVTIATEHERSGTESLVANGGKDGAFTGRLLTLVDSRSASASELFARTMQLAGRGLVLGDRTAGAVMRGRYRSLQQGTETVMAYGVSVTDADLIMPDGGRLEGVGVLPDSLILPTPEALAAGEDPVLARALQMAGLDVTPKQAGDMLEELRNK